MPNTEHDLAMFAKGYRYKLTATNNEIDPLYWKSPDTRAIKADWPNIKFIESEIIADRPEVTNGVANPEWLAKHAIVIDTSLLMGIRLNAYRQMGQLIGDDSPATEKAIEEYCELTAGL